MNKLFGQNIYLGQSEQRIFSVFIFIRNLVPFQASVKKKKKNTREASHLTIMIPTIQTLSKLFQLVLTVDRIEKISSCIFQLFCSFC